MTIHTGFMFYPSLCDLCWCNSGLFELFGKCFFSVNANVHNKHTTEKEDGALQISKMTENPNNYFTYRAGVVEKAVNDCVEQFLDAEEDGPLLNTYLLTS